MGLDYNSYAEAKEKFRFGERWTVFDGTKERFNIAHECVDRHAKDKIAIRIKFADRHCETYSFGELSRLTSQFAHLLASRGIKEGDPVAVLLNPSLEFYVTLFGTLKRGAVVVPCFPAFGPDAIQFRLEKSGAKMIVTNQEKAPSVKQNSSAAVLLDEEVLALLKAQDEVFRPSTSVDSPAFMQFSSGTTGTPKAVPYRHAAASLCAVNMKVGAGLRPDDSYYCPSSPAWGHGIWFGTIGPLIFGNALGSYSGKFDAEIFLEALEEFAVTNVSATPLVYRLAMETGKIHDFKLQLRDISFTGGPLDMDTILYFRDQIGIVPRSMYGSTEVGALLQDFPYFDWKVKPGALGGPMLTLEVAVLDEDGKVLPPGEIGQICMKRGDSWIKTGDAAYVDDDGYFWHKGRADDVIISAGYTIGPQEIEEVLLRHPAVRRAAVIGSPDADRGEIVKAFIVTDQAPGEDLKRDIQEFIRTRLSRHEYPREIEFVAALPETPDGKIKRKELREQERAKKQI